MGWRFYRRISLGRGAHLNLSKGGVSVTEGVPGAHLTVGTSGVTTSAGIPGSGLSYRSRPRGGEAGRSTDAGGCGCLIVLFLVMAAISVIVGVLTSP